MPNSSWILKLKQTSKDTINLLCFYFCSHISALSLCAERSQSRALLSGSFVNGAPVGSLHCPQIWRRHPGQPGPDSTGGALRPI